MGGWQRERFEELLLPHLDAAYGLARWLIRNDELAEDAVQEAYLRALRYFGSLRSDDARPWLLRIVRHVSYEILNDQRLPGPAEDFDEHRHTEESVGNVVFFPVNPEAVAIGNAEAHLVRDCLEQLPADYREVLVLREVQECSYREIAEIAAIPIGTVMSRLARARRLLQRVITDRVRREEQDHELRGRSRSP